MKINSFPHRAILLSLISLLWLVPANAQVQKKKRKVHHGTGVVVEAPPEPQFFTMVQEMPEFPGGEAALQKYFKDNIHYPLLAREYGTVAKYCCLFLWTWTEVSAT